MSESKYMTRTDILDAIDTMSQHQGLYQRIKNTLNRLAEDDPENYDFYMGHLENQHFADIVDLEMYFEC